MAAARYSELATGYHNQSDLEEFRSQASRVLRWSPFVAAAFMVPFLYDTSRPGTSWIPIGVAAVTGLLTLGAARHGTTLSAIALLSGLGLTATAAQYVYAGSPFLVLYSLVVVASTAVRGVAAGFVAAVAGSLAILYVQRTGGDVLPDLTAGTALFAVWAAAAVSWLATSPIHTALDWAWSSYVQMLANTEELRDRQGELGRLSKSLAEACIRLEQMNQELEEARETAEEARRLKAEFAATISHELRTPLNLIIGFSEMMVVAPGASYGEGLPEGYRGDIETIYRNACHVSSLIDDILDLSQIDAQRMALQKDVVSLARVADEAVASMATLFKEEGLDLLVNIPAHLPLLHADPTRLRQVLINLLTNALRHTDVGGVTIRAAFDGREVVVSVADTGVGIAPTDLPRVFEEFQRLSSGKRRGSSGLGLSISKRFIEMHGGSMWVESTPGKGSTFYFTLPVCENVISAVPSKDWSTLTAGLLLQPKRAMVVIDEDGEVAKVFRRYLDAYEVIGASSLDRALELVNEANVQAVVMDSPRMAAEWRRLQRTHSTLQALPTICCSLRTTRDVAQELGVLGYLAKPVTREQLRTALRQLGRQVRSLLVVEDDAAMVHMLTRMVRSVSKHCQVYQAYDGDEGLRLLRETRPDVVLLDLVMPGVDGYAVLDEMRRDEDLRSTAVVVVSARRAGEDVMVARSLDVSRDGGLSVAELMDCVRSCLDALLARPARGNSRLAQPASSGA